MHEKAQPKWIVRDVVLVLCIVACLALAYSEFVAPRGQMPAWMDVQEGPVAHGFDKFYRSIYVKGNIKTAGDLTVAGETNLTAVQLTVTDSLAIPVTSSYIVLTATTPTTPCTLISGTVAGQLLILTGINDTGSITIAEGANHWGGDLAFTNQAYDGGMLIWDGTRWILSSWSDN